jgi:hypothetical protein
MKNLPVPPQEDISNVFLSAYPRYLEPNEVNYNISTLNINSEGGSDFGSFDFDQFGLSSSSEYSKKPGDSQPEVLIEFEIQKKDLKNSEYRQSVTNSTGSPEFKDDPGFGLPEILITDVETTQNSEKTGKKEEISMKTQNSSTFDQKISSKTDLIPGEKTVNQKIFFESSEKSSEKKVIENSLIDLAKMKQKQKTSTRHQVSCSRCSLF